MIVFKKQLALLISILISLSCNKDDTGLTVIVGEWTWVKSVGGIGGWTRAPQTDKVKKHLVIDYFTFKEFENDILVFKSHFELQIRPDTFYETNRYIVFDHGREYAVEFGRDELILYENMWFDGFNHYYQRKK